MFLKGHLRLQVMSGFHGISHLEVPNLICIAMPCFAKSTLVLCSQNPCLCTQKQGWTCLGWVLQGYKAADALWPWVHRKMSWCRASRAEAAGRAAPVTFRSLCRGRRLAAGYWLLLGMPVANFGTQICKAGWLKLNLTCKMGYSLNKLKRSLEDLQLNTLVFWGNLPSSVKELLWCSLFLTR